MSSGMLEIDGGLGEAGGQILRTALGLSCLLGRPFRMFNIRKGRSRQGLMPQHLAGVRAAARISQARVTGDSAGSMEIVFAPSPVRSGEYMFDIGTAGATSLLLQAVLPPLALAKKGSHLILRGGTHVPLSPPFDYLRGIFIPALNRLGLRIAVSIEDYGFYPKGGGMIKVKIEPAEKVTPFNCVVRGEMRSLRAVSGVANLPPEIAGRQGKALNSLLSRHGFKAGIEETEVPSVGRGTFIFLKAEYESFAAGFSALGERGKKAEAVGEECGRDFLDYHRASACLDPYLADQIVPYLALAKGISSFTTARITSHLITNLETAGKFVGMEYCVEGERGEPGRVTINP